MATVANLPPEVLLHIFEYLPLKDVLSIEYGYKEWAWLTKYKSLYRTLVVDADIRLEQILRILPKYSTVVVAVTLVDRDDTNTILKFLAECPNLQRLDMKNCSGTKNECISTALLINVFKKTKLSDFGMKRCTCFVHVLSILPPEPRTRKMIGFSSSDTDSATQDLHFLGSHFLLMLERSFDSLTCLRIEDANINFLTTDFAALFRRIGNLRKLKELSYHVCYLPITDENFREIYNLTSLTSLSLKSLRRVSDKVLGSFFDASRTSSIKKLELFDVATSSEEVVRRIGAGCPDLETLILCQCAGIKETPLTKEMLIELSQACRMLHALRLSYLDSDTVNELVFLTKKLRYLKLLEFEALTSSDCVFKLESVLSEAMPHFDVMSSRFGRVTCQPKKWYYECYNKSPVTSKNNNSLLNKKCQVA